MPAIYIHYPFCKSKCPYCDFNSHVREKTDDEIWRSAYLRELDKAAPGTEGKVTSIFFGGGTPSLMPPSTAEAIINRINDNWGLADDVEITLEANPTSVEYQKFRDFKAAGVNRVSIGVQSFDADELKFLGREHNADEARTAIKYAQDIFENYSFDLIYALTSQTPQQWEKALTEAIKLADMHISLYQLTIEKGTNFYERKVQIPNDESAAEFYNVTQEVTNAHGFPAYEISNHAKQSYESRHNLTYWRYQDYLGIGPGAHGRVNGYATVMTRSPEKWLDNPLESATKLTEQEMLEECVMMGIRLKEGLPISLKPYLKNLAMLRSEGFIEETDKAIKATPKGFLMLNAVIEKLVA